MLMLINDSDFKSIRRTVFLLSLFLGFLLIYPVGLTIPKAVFYVPEGATRHIPAEASITLVWGLLLFFVIRYFIHVYAQWSEVKNGIMEADDLEDRIKHSQAISLKVQKAVETFEQKITPEFIVGLSSRVDEMANTVSRDLKETPSLLDWPEIENTLKGLPDISLRSEERYPSREIVTDFVRWTSAADDIGDTFGKHANALQSLASRTQSATHDIEEFASDLDTLMGEYQNKHQAAQRIENAQRFDQLVFANVVTVALGVATLLWAFPIVCGFIGSQ